MNTKSAYFSILLYAEAMAQLQHYDEFKTKDARGILLHGKHINLISCNRVL